MRRRIHPALPAILGVAALAWLLLPVRGGPGPEGDPAAREPDAARVPDDVDAPALAAGGAGKTRRAVAGDSAAAAANATPAGPLAEPTGAVLEEPALAGPLVVEVETYRPPVPEPGAFEVRVTDPWGHRKAFLRPVGAEQAQAGDIVGTLDFGGAQVGAEAAWSAPSDPTTAGVLTLEGLRQGAYLVSAGRGGLIQPDWMPAWITLGPRETRVRLRRLTEAERGVVEVAVLQGSVRVPAQVTATLRGFVFAVASLDANGDGRFEAPVGEDMALEVAFPGEKGRARPAPQTVRVPSGPAARVEFQVPEAVAVRVRVVGVADGAQASGRAFLFRRTEGGRWALTGQESGDLAAGVSFVATAGPCGALVTDIHPWAPVWKEFDARPGPTPVEVEVPLLAGGVATRLKIEGSDGQRLAIESVWIGHLGGASPTDLAVANVVTGEDGWASLPRLPPGTYHAALRGMLWHPVTIGPDAGETVLRLPAVHPDEETVESATIRGVIVGEHGRGLGSVFIVLHEAGSDWGRYTGFSAGGAFRFAGVTPGDVTLEIPESQLHDEPHARAVVPLRVAPGEARFLVLRVADR